MMQLPMRRCGLARHGARPTSLVRSSKMYVPSDSFGGRSPEKQASKIMRTMFTFVAAKVILAQLEGSGRGSLASYNSDHYEKLATFLSEKPMRDGDQWLADLMHDDRMLALRVLEVRAAYCEKDFEWEQCKNLAMEETRAANMMLMVDAVSSSLHL